MPGTEPYQHPSFSQPADTKVALWRYLDWFKFKWLVESSRLYMPSVKDFPDQLEGTAPQGEVDWWESSVRAASSPEQRDIIIMNRDKMLAFTKMFRPHYYVSCWHMNDAENTRMWHEYTQGPTSVAIRTTLPKLRQALPRYVEIGVVHYIDYQTDRLRETLNMFEYVMHKNAGPFAFEQELRAVALHPHEANVANHKHFTDNLYECEGQPTSRVFAPPIDLPLFIDAVVLHPASSDAHEVAVRTMCAEHRLPQPLHSVCASKC